MTLKQRIMRRIYILYVLRRATSLRAVSLYAFCLALTGTVALVSVSNVFANMASLGGLADFANFMVVALLNTTVFVQALLVVAGISVAVFIRDLLSERVSAVHAL